MNILQEKTDRRSPKRIILQVNDEVHQLIKNRAHRLNMTLTRYVLQAIQMRINKEEGI